MNSVTRAAFSVLHGLAVILLFHAISSAQDPMAGAVTSLAEEDQSQKTLKLREFESLTVNALRREFPRLPGLFSSSSSCRLPDYGPMVSVTLQLPSFYFTRPVLMELERRQKAAEEQARRIRVQIDRAAQLINLKAREAALADRIEREKKAKREAQVQSLESDLAEVRRALQTLDPPETEAVAAKIAEPDAVSELDLNKMIVANYQQMVDRVTTAMKSHLAEYGPKIGDLSETERVSINAHVRDNFFPNQSKSIVFVLDAKDIEAFHEGTLDLPALKEKVLVRHQDKE